MGRVHTAGTMEPDAGPDVVLQLGQPSSRHVVFTEPGADTWAASVDSGDPGQGNRLTTKLREAQAALEVGKTRTAIETLRAFINEVEACGTPGP